MPTGSGAGLGTNVSNDLIMLMVAVLTGGHPPPLPPPPPPPLAGRQHWKVAGPGQRPTRHRQRLIDESGMTGEPAAVFPVVHGEVKRQFPPAPQDVLMQHLTSAGSLGHSPENDWPPPPLHEEVEMQTPGVPFAVQGPFTASTGSDTARTDRARMLYFMMCGSTLKFESNWPR